jgi:hypothetical protein
VGWVRVERLNRGLFIDAENRRPRVLILDTQSVRYVVDGKPTIGGIHTLTATEIKNGVASESH